MSLNIFSQIAMIMLVGIAAKNGVLIVEFANQLRDQGLERVEAVIRAATIRLRPVLMTSLCTAFGSLPFLLATGAGIRTTHADWRGRVLRNDHRRPADTVCGAGSLCTDGRGTPLAELPGGAHRAAEGRGGSAGVKPR